MHVCPLDGAEDWIRAQVAVRGQIEVVHERPWATVMRVPLATDSAWFKACAPVQAFEPRMTAKLFERWPDRVTEVLAYDETRAWMLCADAGARLSEAGNPPEEWLLVLPGYAELQRDETQYARDHLAHGVPDLRLATLPRRYRELVRSELPLAAGHVDQLTQFVDRFASLCADLSDAGIADSVQHDDLHARNVYRSDTRRRVLDWGDASISHPFMSLVVTFRFLQDAHELPHDDPWFARLRDAYLEPWGGGFGEMFALAMRIGAFAHPLVELRHRAVVAPELRPELDQSMRAWLERALAQI